MVRKAPTTLKPSAPASGSHSIICPSCEAGELLSGGHHNGVQYPACGYVPSRSVLQVLRQIIFLPDALGTMPARSADIPRCTASPMGYLTVRGAVRRCYPLSLNAPRKPSARAEVIAKARWHTSRRSGSNEGVQPQARDASAGKEVSYRKIRRIRKQQGSGGMTQTHKMEKV